ncbi:hypothetical protein LOAG_14596, partial [Loa loa]
VLIGIIARKLEDKCAFLQRYLLKLSFEDKCAYLLGSSFEDKCAFLLQQYLLQ